MVGKWVDWFHDYESWEKNKGDNEWWKKKPEYDNTIKNAIDQIKSAEKEYEEHENLAKKPEKPPIDVDEELEKKLEKAYSSDRIPYQISNKENLAANAQISTEGKIWSVKNVQGAVWDMLTAIGIKDTRIWKRLS